MRSQRSVVPFRRQPPRRGLWRRRRRWPYLPHLLLGLVLCLLLAGVAVELDRRQVATASNARPDAPPAGCAALRIDYVYDGDTVVLQLDGTKERVRLLGFDTPELGERARCPAEQAAAKRARDRLRALVRAAGELRFCFDGRDRYGRPLAVLLLDGRDVGPLLIAEGLARPYQGGARAGWCD